MGDTVAYSFAITNTGNVALRNVRIDDPNVTVAGGPLASLAPGARDATTFTASYTLTQDNLDAGNVTNTAIVLAEAPDGTAVTDTSDDPDSAVNVDPDGDGEPDDAPVTPIQGRASLALVKTGTLNSGPDGIVQAGDTITYAFAVENTGSVTVTDIVIDDPLVTVAGGPVASLAPGARNTSSFTAVYTLTQSDMDAGRVENTATVSGRGPGGAPVQDVSDDGNGTVAGENDPTLTTLPQDASMLLLKAATLDDGGDGFADVGDSISYAFTVRNTGSVTLTDITVADPLVAVSGGPLAALVPGAEDSATFTARYVLTQGDLDAGQVRNVATASAQDPNGAPVGAVSDDPANPADSDPDGDGEASDPTVTTLPLNGAPIAANDAVRTPFATPVTLDPRGNDTDPEGDPLTVSPIAPFTGGTAVIEVDGTVTITPDPGFLGILTVPYSVCDDRMNCDTAEIAVTVEDPIANLSGTVFLDRNLDGALDPSEPGQANWTVELVGPDGRVVASVPAGPDGTYAFADIDVRAAANGAPAADFSVRARHPDTGVAYRVIDAVPLTGGTNLTSIDLPVDPIGVVYDSVERVTVPGSRLVVLAPDGTALPTQCFADASQQSQTTGADGQYYFDIRPGAAPQCPTAPTAYTLALTPPQTYVQGPSSIIPVAPDAVNPPPGTGPFPVVADFGPPQGGATTHFMSLVVGVNTRSVTRNNIPVDPMAATRLPLQLTKRAGVASVSLGGVVPYTVTLSNPDSLPYAGVSLLDIMPTGFSLIPGTLVLDGNTVTANRNTAGFTLDNLVVPPGATLTLGFSAGAGTAVQIGDAVNRVVARLGANGRTLSEEAEATVRVLPSAEFDCAEVIGKVFDDLNRNGVQDAGEAGLPGVRVATVNGLLINTDESGRYHLACADVPNGAIGSNFVLKLDPRTLPTGYRMVSENPRVIRLTRGKMSRANFAASLPRIVTLDLEDRAFLPGRLELAPHSAAQLPALLEAVRKGESTVRLNYYARGDERIGQARIDALARHLDALWTMHGCCFELSVERRVVGQVAALPAVHAGRFRP